MLGAGERVAEAEDDPAARGRRPVEPAVGPHLRGQVDDVGLADRVARRDGRRRTLVETGGRVERGLLLEPVDGSDGVQDELSHPGPRGLGRLAGRGRRGPGPRGQGPEAHPEILGGDRSEGDRAGFGRELEDGTVAPAVVAGLQFRLAVPGAAVGLQRHQRQAAHVLRGGELDLDPGRPVDGRGRQEDRLVQVAVGEGGQVERAAARGDLRPELGHGPVVIGRLEGHDGAVGIVLRLLVPAGGDVLIRAGRRGRLGQHAAPRPAAFDARLAPDVLLHRLGRGDPRAAALAPAGRAGDGHLQAEPVGQSGRELERILPGRGHVDEALGDDLGRVEPGVEVLEAGDAGARHPFEVGFDAFLGDVAAHPVPPDARLGARGRRLESLRQGIFRALSKNDPRGRERSDHSGEADPADSGRSFFHGRTPFVKAISREAGSGPRRSSIGPAADGCQ